MLDGTNVCVRVVSVWEETGLPEGNPAARLGHHMAILHAEKGWTLMLAKNKMCVRDSLIVSYDYEEMPTHTNFRLNQINVCIEVSSLYGYNNLYKSRDVFCVCLCVVDILQERHIWQFTSQFSIRDYFGNYARIRSSNQPVLSNNGKVYCSRKQWGPLMWHVTSQMCNPLCHA